MSELDDLLERIEKLSRANFELKQSVMLERDLKFIANTDVTRLRWLLRRCSKALCKADTYYPDLIDDDLLSVLAKEFKDE